MGQGRTSRSGWVAGAMLTLLLLPADSRAAGLTGSFASGKAPYLWEDAGEIRGAEFDIVKTVLRRAGFELHPRAMPNNRLIATFPDSDFDFATGLQPSDLPGYCHTSAYMSYHNIAITRRADHIALNDPAALLHYKVAIRQYLYQDLGLDRLGTMPAYPPGNFTEFTAQDQQVRFFFAGRADVIILDQTIFQWYAKRLDLLPAKQDALEVHDLFPAKHGVRAAFKDPKLCEAFDRNLAAIVADGSYRAIWRSYGIDDVRDPGK